MTKFKIKDGELYGTDKRLHIEIVFAIDYVERQKLYYAKFGIKDKLEHKYGKFVNIQFKPFKTRFEAEEYIRGEFQTVIVAINRLDKIIKKHLITP